MSVVRRAFVLSVGIAVAACAWVYLAAKMPSVPSLPAATTAVRAAPSTLTTPCHKKAKHLRRQLRGECGVVVQEPFVIAGDFAGDCLEGKHCTTIELAQRAMVRQYFERPPDRPVAILLFSNETTYRRYAELLFFDRNVSRFGYFKPGRYTILANLAWGDGPLLHELTHVLMHFDFPEAAVWLREGLASLHEATSLVASREHWVLEGNVNWRLDVLVRQIRAERVQGLYELIQTVAFDGDEEAINCAQARYFCLFLQQKNVLSEIYRHYRASHKEDPCGEKAILREFPGRDWRDMETEFNGWVMSLATDGLPQKAGELPESGFKTGRARLRPSRNRGKTRLSGSFALPDSGSETPF